MTIFARSRRVRSILTPLAASLLLLGLFAVASAQAQVVSIGSIPTGIQARVGAAAESSPSTYANNAGNPVVHEASTYVIYWDPTDHIHGDWQNEIDSFMQSAGAATGSGENVFAVDSQYTDKTNAPASDGSDFHGAYTDTTPYPSNGCVDPEPFEEEDRIGAGLTSVCLSSAQVAAEIEGEIKREALPTGMNTIYYLITPPGVTVCLDAGGAAGHCSDYQGELGEKSYENSFCSYHSDINPGGPAAGSAATILYGVIPWTAGGFGDFHLTTRDEALDPGWTCQDGGFDPASEPPGEFEKPYERNAEEIEKIEKENTKEKREARETEELEGPHAEEPNQIAPCPPWGEDGSCDRGLPDLLENQISNEEQNIVTDPLLNGWQDSAHDENTDECRFVFDPVLEGSVVAQRFSHAGTLNNQDLAGRKAYLNDAFNLAAGRLPFPGVRCMNGLDLVPRFTAPNTVNAGEVVGFDGMESDITLDAGIDFPGGGAPAANYATYRWELGDGTVIKGYAPGAPVCEAPWLSPCAASVFHTYAYGGYYTVKLTVTDVGGNVASVSHVVTVNGPPAPSGSAGGGAGSGAPGSSGTTLTIVNPVASASVLSRSLSNVLSKGLVVRYSVNEQVAGHFEVLISRTLDRKLKIGGATATGLPSGTPPEVVIAKALLVTTKAGHSTISIRFSKSVAAKLRHQHHVPLMLRLFVRNAASKSPATSTIITSVSLRG